MINFVLIDHEIGDQSWYDKKASQKYTGFHGEEPNKTHVLRGVIKHTDNKNLTSQVHLSNLNVIRHNIILEKKKSSRNARLTPITGYHPNNNRMKDGRQNVIFLGKCNYLLK